MVEAKATLSVGGRRPSESSISGFDFRAPGQNIRARSLYEQLGGTLIGQHEAARPRGTLVEVAYGWAAPLEYA